MKPFSVTSGIVLFLCSILFMNSCKEDISIESSTAKPKYAFLRDLNKNIFQEFKPDLLAHIVKDLVSKNKNDQAIRLANTYDLKTGKLKPEPSLVAAKSTSGARTSSGFYYQYAFTQGTPSGGGASGSGTADVNGECTFGNIGLWLTGFRFDTPSSYSAQWGNSNSFCINAHIQGGSWYGPTAASAGVNTFDNTKRLDSFWIWVGENIADYTWYKAYLSNYTETSYTANGASCGVVGSGNSIIIITFICANVE